jgi:putative membrane protein
MTTSDPRVFFAAERTLLAWVRSSITVMTLGFVVAKFGLFLSLLSASNTTLSEFHQDNGLSKVLGITLIITGAAITLGAQLNHHLYVKSLPPIDVPKLAITWLVPLLTFSIAFIGFLLATYLVLA